MSKFKKVYDVPFPMNLDDALNNYDSNNYEVDSEGSWEDTETINEFREEASDDLLHSPAAVDDDHLIFYNEDDDHIEVMNMIPKHHLDSLHNNPSKKTKWVKRAAIIKLKNDAESLNILKKMFRERKFNLACSDIIKIYKRLITNYFGNEELNTIEFEISKSGHLKIHDTITGDTFTASCHFKGRTDSYNPGEINILFDMMANSINYREQERAISMNDNTQNRELLSASNKWIKYGPVKWKKLEDESENVEAKNHGGLDDWFKKEKWVDVSRPKKDGKWQPCGRGDTSKGKKPVCTPVNKAKGLSEKERKNRVRQKRQKEKEPNPDKKPNVTKYTEQAGGKSNIS